MNKSEKILIVIVVVIVIALLGVIVWQLFNLNTPQSKFGTWQIVDEKPSASATTTRELLTHTGTIATSTMEFTDERIESIGFNMIVVASTTQDNVVSAFPTLRWKFEYGYNLNTEDWFEDLLVGSGLTSTTTKLTDSSKLYEWTPTSSTTLGVGTHSFATGLATGTTWYFNIPSVNVLGKKVKAIFYNPSTTTPFEIWYSAILKRESR